MTIKRKELLAALEAVQPGLAKDKEIMLQTAAFMFRDKRVYTYNDQIAVSHAVPTDISATVHTNDLYNMLKRMSEDEVELTVRDGELLVSGRRSKTGIALRADFELPLGEVTTKKTWKQLAKNFADALAFTLQSASGNLAQPELTCVNVSSSRLEACDGFRATRYATGLDVKDSMMIPAKSCKELVKFAPTHFAVSENWIHFTNKAGAEFSCRTVYGAFPDLDPFFKKSATHRVSFPDDMSSVLDRASVFLSDTADNVLVSVAESMMTVSARNDSGWFSEKLRTRYKGAPIEFYISPSLLSQMLEHVKDVAADEELSVLKFDGESFTYVCVVAAKQ